jgi:predicted Rossmann fold nucleotide-binding protein DprA/Smf involved in DNA uptake
MNLVHISQDDPRYPPTLRTRSETPAFIAAVGNLDILRRKKLALFCSVKCPGALILQTYDLARALRDAGVTVISGFHSPMEKECLTLLLRGTQPVIICPARSIERMRVPTAWKVPLEENRLLILSPFAGKQHRATADLAAKRNAFVAALAEEIFVAYAAPGSKIEFFCRDLLSTGKSLLTLDSSENARLFTLGAKPLRFERLGMLQEMLIR